MKKLLRLFSLTMCIVLTLSCITVFGAGGYSATYNSTNNTVNIVEPVGGDLWYTFSVTNGSGTTWYYDNTTDFGTSATMPSDTSKYFETGVDVTSFPMPTSVIADGDQVQMEFFYNDGATLVSACSLSYTASVPATVATVPSIDLQVVSSNSTQVDLTANLATENPSLGLLSFKVTDSKGGIVFQNNFPDASATTASFPVTLNYNDTFTFYVQDTVSGWRAVEYKVDSIKGVLDESQPAQDTTAPTIKYSGLPESAKTGEEQVITITTDEKCDFNIEGRTYTDTNEIKYSIYDNGSYTVYATDKAGNQSSITIEAKCFSDEVDTSYIKANRNGIWGEVKGLLPQTGGIALVTVLILCLGGIGVGSIMVFRKRKNVDIAEVASGVSETEDNELYEVTGGTETEFLEDENSEIEDDVQESEIVEDEDIK